MLTLSDINTATNSRDGDTYSDLYKDVYGHRPRYSQFESVEAFDAAYRSLVKRLNDVRNDRRMREAHNFADFVKRIEEIQNIMNGCSRDRAVEILAEAEGISEEDFNFYGFEMIEYHFGLEFRSISKWLAE